MRIFNLQNIILPDRKICNEDELYFRVDSNSFHPARYDEPEGKLVFQKYSQVAFDTYFNSFSINKWVYYTNLKSLHLNLRIKGKFILWVNSGIYGDDGRALESAIFMEEISDGNGHQIEIPISKLRDGSIYFKLESLEHDAEFYGGEWCTFVEDHELNPSKIAIVICTYKREGYIKQIIESINGRLFEPPVNSLRDELFVYIIDNGNSLDEQMDYGPNIVIIPNINAGGSGGFARGMLVANDNKDKHMLTHLLLMDDDVRVEPESIVRTLNFLKLIKLEFAEAFVGGSMMRMDRPGIIHESGALFDIKGFHPLKHNLDVKLWNNALLNEIPEAINFFGWWYCVIPMSIGHEDNLPLPLFMRLDDVEYGLRNMRKGITLNGISIWHEPFEQRHSSVLEYYYIRNFMIIGAYKNLTNNPFVIMGIILRKLILLLLHYNYVECDQIINAILDFYRGVDWLVAQEPAQLHARISSQTPKQRDVRDLDFNFKLEKYTASLDFKDGGVRKILRLITFNGYLLPVKKESIIIYEIAKGMERNEIGRNVLRSRPFESIVTNDVTQGRKRIGNMYRAKKVMQYDITTNRGIIFERNIFRAFLVIMKFCLTSILLLFTLTLKNYEYRKRIQYIQTRNFWEEYLRL